MEPSDPTEVLTADPVTPLSQKDPVQNRLLPLVVMSLQSPLVWNILGFFFTFHCLGTFGDCRPVFIKKCLYCAGSLLQGFSHVVESGGYSEACWLLLSMASPVLEHRLWRSWA